MAGTKKAPRGSKRTPRDTARSTEPGPSPVASPSEDPRRTLAAGLRAGAKVVIFADRPEGWTEDPHAPLRDVTIPAVATGASRDKRAAIANALVGDFDDAKGVAKDAARRGGEYRIGGPIDSADGFLRVAGAALLDAAADLVEMDSWEATGTNQLTFIGDLVSTAVRRRWLWDALVSQDFHLGKAAQLLRLASGPPAIARMIKDLGLAERVEQARAQLADRRGGRPRDAG